MTSRSAHLLLQRGGAHRHALVACTERSDEFPINQRRGSSGGPRVSDAADGFATRLVANVPGRSLRRPASESTQRQPTRWNEWLSLPPPGAAKARGNAGGLRCNPLGVNDKVEGRSTRYMKFIEKRAQRIGAGVNGGVIQESSAPKTKTAG
jgi:hypothetical protein